MIRIFVVLSLLFVSSFSSASTVYYWKLSNFPSNGEFSSAIAACNSRALVGHTNPEQWLQNETATSAGCWRKSFNSPTPEYQGLVNRSTRSCSFGNTGLQCNASCDAPNTMVDGQCVAPPPDPCFALYGQSKGFTLSGNSSDPGAFYQPISGSNYWSSPNSVVLGGCSATVNTGTKCKVFGDGAYTCVGTATYQGITADPSAGEQGSDECSAEDCPDTEPTPTSGGSSECTNWVEDAEGRRTRTCETTSEASQSGQAACLTNGSLVCVAPSPTPESDTKTRTDNIKETTNADGSKSTETTSTTTKTYCSAGACTTTNTTNKTTVVNDAAGNQKSENNSIH